MIGLYAIVLDAPRRAVGAQGEPLRAVRCQGFSALVSTIGRGSAGPPRLSAPALRAHEAAVRRIAEASEACLPARFGASAPDDEALQRELAGRAAEMNDALALVRGREQMTLRVHAAGAPALGRGAPGAAPPEGAAGGGTRYLEERRRAGKFAELDPLRRALVELVRAERLERHAEPGLLASVYHLIDRGASAPYRSRAEAEKLAGLRLSISGPWPAWSFAPEVLAP